MNFKAELNNVCILSLMNNIDFILMLTSLYLERDMSFGHDCWKHDGSEKLWIQVFAFRGSDLTTEPQNKTS